jgi:prepilin-type processing-associated H-X9-DG protein
MRQTTTNYWSYPLNRHWNLPIQPPHPDLPRPIKKGITSTTHPELECARGKTPAEYIGEFPDLFTKGRLWDYFNQPRWNGRLIQDAYNPNPSIDPQFYAHKNGTNILFYDLRVEWIRDPRNVN